MRTKSGNREHARGTNDKGMIADLMPTVSVVAFASVPLLTGASPVSPISSGTMGSKDGAPECDLG